MRRSRQEKIIEPECNGSERRAGCDHSARKRDGILPQEIDRLRPVPEAFAEIHVKFRRSLSSIFSWLGADTLHFLVAAYPTRSPISVDVGKTPA
jgi:hypothetical protein